MFRYVTEIACDQTQAFRRRSIEPRVRGTSHAQAFNIFDHCVHDVHPSISRTPPPVSLPQTILGQKKCKSEIFVYSFVTILRIRYLWSAGIFLAIKKGMQMKVLIILKSLLIFVFISFYLSCNKASDKSGESTTTELEGTWSTLDCVTVTEEGDQEAVSWAIVFQGSRMTKTVLGYSTSCTDPARPQSFKMIYEFGFTLGSDVSSPSGAKKIDLVLNSIKATPLSDGSVSDFNTSPLCTEITTWKKNEEKDITGETCLGEKLSVGTNSYDIYKLDGTTKLYLGIDAGKFANTDATRPTQLQSFYLEKK